MASIYQTTISTAWKLTKKAKLLWVLGLFAALPGGGGGEYERFLNLQQFNDTRGLILGLFDKGEATTRWTEILNVFTVWFKTENLPSTFLSLMLVLAILLVALVAQGGLVESIAQLQKRSSRWTLRDGIRSGFRHLGPVLGVNLIARVIVYGALFIFGLPFLLLFRVQEQALWDQLFYVVFFLALIPFDLIISFVVRYAIVFIVVARQGVGASLRSAFHLFRRHWILSLEMALFLFLVSVAAGLVVLLISGLILQAMIVYNSLLTLWMALILLLILFVGAGLAAFQYSVWTFLAMELMEEDSEAKSKIEEWLHGTFGSAQIK